MFRKLDPPLELTIDISCAKYPDEYILMRMNSKKFSETTGTVLYVGDDGDELFTLAMTLSEPSLCRVHEGFNLQRSLGGVVKSVVVAKSASEGGHHYV